MIHSTHRFHGRSSLRFVYQHGKQVRGELVSLRAIPNKRRSTWRCAVVVSRKVSKSAVVRNRIRRRIFEIVRRNAGRITGPYDVVFNVYSEHIASIDNMVLSKCIVEQMEKAGVCAPATETPDHAIVKQKETL